MHIASGITLLTTVTLSMFFPISEVEGWPGGGKTFLEMTPSSSSKLKEPICDITFQNSLSRYFYQLMNSSGKNIQRNIPAVELPELYRSTRWQAHFDTSAIKYIGRILQLQRSTQHCAYGYRRWKLQFYLRKHWLLRPYIR